ncbi:FG-GAP repeat protein [Saprospiraceae bacterium]|nr:FG-GAP repeat protein [Saprospiraceae bacterium]
MFHKYLFTFFLCMLVFEASTQCNNSAQWPSAPVSGSALNDTITIATNNYAGDYASLVNLKGSENYYFSSSTATDYITIRTSDQSTVLSHGLSPLYLALPIDIDAVNIHINSNASCATENIFRETNFACITCPTGPPKIGINTTSPEATLDVNGEIRISESILPPKAGAIRYNSTLEDFEGFNGSNWVSLTKTNGSWGRVKSEEIYPNNEIFPPNGTEEEQMGWSIDMEGDYAAIGTSQRDNNTDDLKGSVYILKRESGQWNIEQILTAPDGFDLDGFGYSVDIDDDLLFIGAAIGYTSTPVQGAVYIFKRNTDVWQFEQKLQAFDAQPFDNFGFNVTAQGNTLVVSSPYVEVNSINSAGAIYIFEKQADTFAFQNKFFSVEPTLQTFFGNEIVINNENIIIGHYDKASLEIITKTNGAWVFNTTVVPPAGTVGIFYGNSIVIQDDLMIVGAPTQEVIGAIDLYDYDANSGTASFASRFFEPDGLNNSGFGYSLDVAGNYVIVGYLASEKARLLRFSDNDELINESLILPDNNSSSQFGYSVKMDDKTILIGAPEEIVNGQENHGKVYQINRNH